MTGIAACPASCICVDSLIMFIANSTLADGLTACTLVNYLLIFRTTLQTGPSSLMPTNHDVSLLCGSALYS